MIAAAIRMEELFIASLTNVKNNILIKL
jgi:hypothetical protein